MEKEYGFYHMFECAKPFYKIDKNFKNLVNFDQQLPQNFSFPYFIIEYICTNCNLKVSRKLMLLCKYLRCLQVRVGFCHLENIIAEVKLECKRKLIFEIQLKKWGDVFRFVIKDFSEIRTEFKAIKVNGLMKIACSRKQEIDDFLFSLNLSSLHSIYLNNKNLTKRTDPIHIDLTFPSAVIDHILNISIQRIIVIHLPHQNSLIKLSFSKLQKLTALEFFSFELFTRDTFKALINTNRKEKITVFDIGHLSFDIKTEDIFQFLDTHMDVDGGDLRLRYNDVDEELSEESKKFLSEFQTIMKARKENNIRTCECTLFFTIFHKYEFPKI